MDEVQGADGVVWTWGAPASGRGASVPKAPAVGSASGADPRYAGDAGEGYVPAPPAVVPDAAPDSAVAAGSGADADAEAARAEEEWFAAGLTVRRPAVPASTEEPPGRADPPPPTTPSTPDEPAASEEEWLAAGLTVRRPTPPPDVEIPPAEVVPVVVPAAEVVPVDAPRAEPPAPDPAPDLAPDDETTRAEAEWEAAGMTVRRPIVPTGSLPEAPPEDARHEQPAAVIDPGLAPTPQDERDDGYEGRHHAAEEARALQAAEEARSLQAAEDARQREVSPSGSSPPVESQPVDEMVSEGAPVASPSPVADAGPVSETSGPQPADSTSRPDQAEGWNGPQGGPQWQQQAQPTPGQWPGQEPWQHDGGQHAADAEQTWHPRPGGSTSAASPAAESPAAHGVDPAYTWRGERGELYVWDGYQWVLQPESPATSLPVPQQASAQPQPTAEHTWDGPNGEYWVWDGYQWVQRERPAPAVATVDTGHTGRAGGVQVAEPQPAEVTSHHETWDGPNGEYWVWDGYQWTQRERPAAQAAADPVQTWTGDDGQVWEWDAAGRQWHRQQGQQPLGERR